MSKPLNTAIRELLEVRKGGVLTFRMAEPEFSITPDFPAEGLLVVRYDVDVDGRGFRYQQLFNPQMLADVDNADDLLAHELVSFRENIEAELSTVGQD